jgi:ubiquinone biosynthesis protein UbiJ
MSPAIRDANGDAAVAGGWQNATTVLALLSQAAARAPDTVAVVFGEVQTIYPAQLENMVSEDYVEGPRAFAEKRTPNWRNR